MKKISPSLMCVDYFDLKNAIEIFEKNKIDYIHIDVMDGNFVPNITLGIDFIKKIRENTHIPLDVHLMINDVDDKIDWFEFKKGEIVSIHVETTRNIELIINKLKGLGCKILLAIKPKTNIERYLQYINIVDGFLIMTVEPGFAGQKMIVETLEKIKLCNEFFESKNIRNKIIEVDGNVSYKNAEIMSRLGANMFVAGTSSFLSKNSDIISGIKKFKEIISV